MRTPLPAGSAPYRSVPAGLVEHEPMNLSAPDKAARMAAIQNNLLPVPGFISRETAKDSDAKHPTSSIQHPASNIQHPTSSIQHPASNIQHPTSSIQHPASSIHSSPVLPASSKRSERVVKNIFNHPFLSVIRGQEDGRRKTGYGCPLSRAA
jgi:hypothetical protein